VVELLEGPLPGNWATSNYFGVAGAWGFLTAGEGELLSPEDCGSLRLKYFKATDTGVLYENSWTRISEIKDGTSTTLMVGERGWTSNSGLLSGSGIADACPGGWTDVVLTSEDNLNLSGLRARPHGDQESFSWWSHHKVSLQFLLCDGTVRAIACNMDQNVFKSLCTKSAQDNDLSEF
jgi:hypothetical protein